MIFGIRKQKKIWSQGTTKKIDADTVTEIKSSTKKKKKTGRIGCPNCKGGIEE